MAPNIHTLKVTEAERHRENRHITGWKSLQDFLPAWGRQPRGCSDGLTLLLPSLPLFMARKPSSHAEPPLILILVFVFFKTVADKLLIGDTLQIDS